MVLGALAVVVLVIFIFLVNFYYQQLTSGAAVTHAVNGIRQSAKIDLLQNGSDPSIGPKDAPVTIVAFEDFQCPYCFQAQPFIRRMLAKYPGDVRFIFKDFPLTAIHENAQAAAEAAQCAFEQNKFWEFHDELFAHQDKLVETYFRVIAKDIGLNITQFNSCYNTGTYRQDIADDAALGRSLQVVGTPTFFINGELFSQGYESKVDNAFYQAIDYIRSLNK